MDERQIMSLRKILTALVFLLSPGIILPQTINVGKIISYIKTENGIEGKTTSSFFYIKAYNDYTIRVRISKDEIKDNFSYILTSNIFPSFRAEIKDENTGIKISTKAIDVIVEKEPSLRLIFKNKSGKTINEDVYGEGFGTTFIGNRVSSYKVLQPGERFVGLGEVLGNLDKRGMGFTLNNTDTYKYGDPRLSMYLSVPFFIGIHDNEVYGLFYHNTYQTFFNFGQSTPFTSINAEGGDADYFFIYDNSIPRIIEHYTELTGRISLPPKWSLGYHQSRCSYYPQANVKLLAETFREKKIPVDCIVLDADYLYEYEPFRINTERFPDLKRLADDLRNLDMEITASVNPGIKIDSTYDAWIDGYKKDVYLKYSDGSLFVSDISPNTNHYVDFTNPQSRIWWINKMKFLPENGIHGYWNDMNEPAVGGSYLPDNLMFDFDGKKANSLEAKNLYGYLMARSSYESALKYSPDKRPFILTRSGFAGVQRYSAVWTGDNTASDEFLLVGILLNNQMGLSGIPFVGPDLGGYIGDGTKELFTRWMQIGVFSPFLRNHKGSYTTANEPWAYGEEAEAISRSFIGFRYRLMPYIYSLFYTCTQTGLPVSKSLCIDYPFANKVYDNLYQFESLFGDAMLVIPVTSIETIKKIYLPKGEWYDMFTEELIHGETEFAKEIPVYRIPVYIKASSVIPMQSLVQSTKEKPSDTLFIHIYFGEFKNDFLYYEDAGDGPDYTKNVYCKRYISFDPVKKKIIFTPQQGSFESPFKLIKLVLHGFDKELNRVLVNNEIYNLKKNEALMLDGLEFLSNVYLTGYYKSLKDSEIVPEQKFVNFNNSKEQIVIEW